MTAIQSPFHLDNPLGDRTFGRYLTPESFGGWIGLVPMIWSRVWQSLSRM